MQGELLPTVADLSEIETWHVMIQGWNLGLNHLENHKRFSASALVIHLSTAMTRNSWPYSTKSTLIVQNLH